MLASANPNQRMCLAREKEWSKHWFQFILDHPNICWSYSWLSDSPNITWDIVQANPDKLWNYVGLSGNPSITWDIVRSNPDKPWNYRGLSENPNITWDIVQSNPTKRWCYRWLSYNPNITWDIVQSNPDRSWDYDKLCENPSITWGIVQSNPDKPWNYCLLSGNPSITWDNVRSNPDKDWDYCSLSTNPSITWDIVRSNPDEPWDYAWLSSNPNITWDIIQENPDYPWDYDWLSVNPSITWDVVRSNPDIPWNYQWLSKNPMTGAKDAFFREWARTDLDIITRIQESSEDKYMFLRTLDPPDSIKFCAQMVRTLPSDARSAILETDTISLGHFMSTLRELSADGQLRSTYHVYIRSDAGDAKWFYLRYRVSGGLTRKQQRAIEPSFWGWVQTFLYPAREPPVVHLVIVPETAEIRRARPSDRMRDQEYPGNLSVDMRLV